MKKGYRIRFCEGLKVASKILQALQQRGIRLPKEDADSIHVESYSNCREQGYAVIGLVGFSQLYASFAENRNSDQIVVYFDQNYLDPGGNVPSDEAWEHRQFFEPGDYKGAANAIASWFEQTFQFAKKEWEKQQASHVPA